LQPVSILFPGLASGIPIAFPRDVLQVMPAMLGNKMSSLMLLQVVLASHAEQPTAIKPSHADAEFIDEQPVSILLPSQLQANP
jgi:hypothetical protein